MKEGFYTFCTCLYRVFSIAAHPVKVVGAENVPMTGRAIVCANHRSFQDPLLMATYIKRKMHFMAKKEIFSNKLLGALVKALGAFPVARGEKDLTAIRTSFKLMDAEKALGIFPEGKRFSDGEIHQAQNGVSMIALRCKAPVIPAYIKGDYKLFRRMELIVGKPVDLADFGGKMDQDTLNAASARIRSAIQALAEK